MKPDARSLLWDMEQAARAISRFIAGMTFPEYAASEIVQSAVERKFEIIGEAMSRLAKADRALAARIPRHRETIAFRNLLIHGYAAVEHERVWRTATESLPSLLSSLSSLLGGDEPAA